MMTFEEIRSKLKENAEEEFAAFSSKIIPTSYPMLGVRTPTVKKLAKEADPSYFGQTPHYYEEVLVYGFTLGRLGKTAAELFEALPDYLKYVDNWAAIDSPLSGMVALKKDKENCLPFLYDYLKDEREYYARFGCVALFSFIDEKHIDEVLEIYKTVPKGRYYVDMAIAWGLSIAAVRFYDKTLAALKEGAYGEFVTNKAISKCRDSFRLTATQKEELKAYRMK